MRVKFFLMQYGIIILVIKIQWLIHRGELIGIEDKGRHQLHVFMDNNTPFAKETAGTMEQTLRLLAMIRLIHPRVLLPSTTALGTIHPQGREKGILAGANVVMPNLSPVSVRKQYMLYDNKICTGEEAAECRGCLANRMKNIGCQIVTDRGDCYKK